MTDDLETAVAKALHANEIVSPCPEDCDVWRKHVEKAAAVLACPELARLIRIGQAVVDIDVAHVWTQEMRHRGQPFADTWDAEQELLDHLLAAGDTQ